MQRIAIKEVSFSPEASLRIVPDTQETDTFQWIHRAGAGTRWEPASSAFIAYEPHNWKPFDLFRQILTSAEGELGVQLHLTSRTRWAEVPEELRDNIESWMAVQEKFRP